MIRRYSAWLVGITVFVAPCVAFAQGAALEAERHFESKVRPLFVERCHKCHSGNATKGGLRLDSRESALNGGESGAAIVVGKPDDSLLMQAVRHQNGLAMPPDGKLNDAQIAALTEWIKLGAVWPGGTAPEVVAGSPAISSIAPTPPNDAELATWLQLWLRADSLTLNDSDPVYVWPDQSGHGRDVSATKGIRNDGAGLPARFVRESSLMKRPAVRFDTTTGMASSPDHPVEIRGDAALTMMLVMNLQPHEAQPPYDTVLGIGNPAHAGDPGRPLAALVQINRAEDHSLHFAGGWNHDASLGKASFKPHFGQPVLLTVTKQPGPMRSSTTIFINGTVAMRPNNEPLEGTDGIPDIQHRSDIGVFLGKALSWAGSIQGDLGEVVVYNRALTDQQRLNVECHLAEKFGLMLKPLQSASARAVFTAKEKSLWAYQPVKESALPIVKQNEWVKSPIDQFVLQQWEAKGLGPAPPTDKLTLLRRVTFDLIGLPPTPDEVVSFLHDDSLKAYEKVVDRLLESPHYGERWARHWLDVVRYAETTANDANAVMQFAWRYRNYVIDAFNRDLPYDQFLIEQLAGDLLPLTDSVETNTRRVVATGYLMVGPKALAETDKEQSRLDIVDDQIDVTGRAMLGLTLACARCHDHKFDAIRASDYYAIAGIFRSTEPFQNENRNATMWWEFPVAQGEGKEPIMVMAPKEAVPRNLRIHLRGNRFTLGTIVPRGMLDVVEQVTASGTESINDSIEASQLSSGRLQLARWIASSSNPLTPRVMVNRIWQHHFGRGLVATSDNFGTRGEEPSHPELLDWLAANFVKNGWSMKSMHRLMVLSSSYQQSGFSDAAMRDADPDRRWLTSFPRRRLSAEELRDGMLAASGQLDRLPGASESSDYLISKAESIGAMIKPNRVAADDPFYSSFAKRSVYLPVVRNMLPDVLALFDAADPNGVTAQRNETTVASQSLFLLNSPFVREQSRALAERLRSDKSMSDVQRIDLAHRLTLGRPPFPEEQVQASEFITAYVTAPASQGRDEDARQFSAWQSYCQSLLCENEFLYVE